MIDLKHLKKCHSLKSLPATLDLSNSLNFCTDTRRYRHPSAFVAIPGQKVNPLDIIGKLLQEGCPIVFYQQDEQNIKKIENLKEAHPQTNFLPVSDSVIFLQELSHEHIKSWKEINKRNTVFAISGSNGKTTHKEMLSFILKEILPGKVVSTEKNNNNHLGVPLTLLQVSEQTEIVVLELGSNHPGEIKTLCDIAVPNAGITTNIGATHLEFFGSEEKVFEEEAYLFHAVNSITHGKGFFLLNKDDQFLSKITPTEGTISYGECAEAEAKVTYLEDGAQIRYKGKNLLATNSHITGRHNKLNIITCVFIAAHFYPEFSSKIIDAIKGFRPTKNRSEWIQFENRSIFLDAYNANPSSMKAALLGFKDSVIEQGFKMEDACVVLGDMNELGEKTQVYHQDVGHYIKELGFKNVYFIGRFAKFYLLGFPNGTGKDSAAEFKSEYRSDCIKKHQIHFIKGSRSLQLESLFDIT